MKATDSVEQPERACVPSSAPTNSPLRPVGRVAVPLEQIAALAGTTVPKQTPEQPQLRAVNGVSLDSRQIVPGDLYIAVPGAHAHGAGFVTQAVEAGAVAILTDDAGVALMPEGCSVPVLCCPDPRGVTGAVAALVYGTGAGKIAMELFAVTGTNGKTTTTYFLNSLLRALGKTTGLIGTIEILAGDEPIPSRLTTPESTDVHALLAVMAERGLDAASMEVSSHALAFGRVDSVLFDIAGFTNLSQDHLDLHGDMEDYFATKSELFTARRTRRAVVSVDDEWGQRLADTATVPVATLATLESWPVNGVAAPSVDGDVPSSTPASWRVTALSRRGIGSQFELQGPEGITFRVHTGLPGDFNVSNAALALTMVAEQMFHSEASACDEKANVVARIQAALDAADPFSVSVPGRMQLVGTAPVSVVDFAHNPDALERALTAVRSPVPGSRVIVVFGATGERDVTKRPIMGAIAAEHADIVLVTDDDPHDEDRSGIRSAVMAGAIEAARHLSTAVTIEEFDFRVDAIFRAVELSRPIDTILVAGRGHEINQEIQGVNVALDDRLELRSALKNFGFPVVVDSLRGP